MFNKLKNHKKFDFFLCKTNTLCVLACLQIPVTMTTYMWSTSYIILFVVFFVIHVHVYDYRYLILQLDKLGLKRQILSTFKSFSTD